LITYRSDESINEVILSGGDPLSVPDRLSAMDDGPDRGDTAGQSSAHSQPSAGGDSGSVSRPALVALLANTRLRVSLVMHANHAQELDDSVATAL
jgi:L-lysine 2,3-aminomutase